MSWSLFKVMNLGLAKFCFLCSDNSCDSLKSISKAKTSLLPNPKYLKKIFFFITISQQNITFVSENNKIK